MNDDRAPRPPRILAQMEAENYVLRFGREFRDWAKRWDVQPLRRASRGYPAAYDTRDLDAAIDREKGIGAAAVQRGDEIQW